MRPSWGDIPTHNHPATFSAELFPVLVEALKGQRSVIDPMAGVGKIHAIAEAAGVPYSVGVELEREWANQEMFPPVERHSGPTRIQYVSDARKFLEAWSVGPVFSSACFSPDYGNRMADGHEAKDPCSQCKGTGFNPLKLNGPGLCPKCKGSGLSPRNTYKHRLGRKLSEGSVVSHFGPVYKFEHAVIYNLLVRNIDLSAPDPLIVLNVKNFLRTTKGKQGVVDVTDWHVEVFKGLGWGVSKWHRVHVKGNGHGQNREVRVEFESVIEFRPIDRSAG